MMNKGYIPVFFICFAAFLFAGCDMILDGDADNFKKRKEVKVKPVKVDVSDIRKQGEELERLFEDKFVPLEYSNEKDPFKSVVDLYQASQKSVANSENPLRELTLDQISLVGTLEGEVGTIGVLNAGGNVYYVKSGDKIGKKGGVIIDISDKKLRLRQSEEDIFGNVRSVIKELSLETKEENT